VLGSYVLQKIGGASGLQLQVVHLFSGTHPGFSDTRCCLEQQAAGVLGRAGVVEINHYSANAPCVAQRHGDRLCYFSDM
jgi:hypothetical protein